MPSAGSLPALNQNRHQPLAILELEDARLIPVLPKVWRPGMQSSQGNSCVGSGLKVHAVSLSREFVFYGCDLRWIGCAQRVSVQLDSYSPLF